LGQHYIANPAVVRSIIEAAAIQTGERVFEIGTGRGALTKELVGISSFLEGYEVDGENYEYLKRELASPSLILRNEDAFASSSTFDVLVSSLPYSESSRFVEWLSQRKYDRAVVLLQADFVRKIAASPGSPDYRAVSVISQVSVDVEVISDVSRLDFDPPPRVDSALVKMRWKKTLTSGEIGMIKRIFSQKRRTVRAALKNLGLVAPVSVSASPEREYLQCRVNSLRPDSVISMIDLLARSESKRTRQ